MDLPYISIITATLNSENTIAENLKSVESQSYRNFEHIIIDGGSTDETLKIIKEFNREVIVSSEPDQGISDAFNKGIRLSRGKIIGILNSDDYYDADILSHVADAFLSAHTKFILHGMMRLFDQEKDFMLKPRPLPGLFKYLDMPYYHPTMFVPKEIYDDVGVYSLDYQYAMDYDFVLRALGKGYRFQYLPKLITHFRHGGSANSNALACHKEVLESQIRNGLNLLVCRLTYYFKVMVNKLKGLVAKSL